MNKFSNIYKIGPISIKVNTNSKFDNNIELFKEDYNIPNTDITINHIYNFFLKPFKTYKNILNTKEWLVQKSKDDYFYHYKPYNIKAITNEDNTLWNVNIPRKMRNDVLSNLGGFYSDQIILYPWLIKNKGIFLHGNTLYKDGKGIILIGNSGNGKTTLSKMLEDDGWLLLCDDRTLIINNRSYGHWCHGSYNKVRNFSCNIEKVFFVNKANKSFTIPSENTIIKFYEQIVNHNLLTNIYPLNIYVNMVNSGIKFYDLFFDLSGDIKKVLKKDII